MKKFRLLPAVAAICGIVFGAFAAEPAAPRFSIKVLPTRAVNIDDQFSGILPKRPPLIPTVSRAVAGEPFEVRVFYRGAAIRYGCVSLTGKLAVVDPAGKRTEVPLKGKALSQSGIKGDTGGVFVLPMALKVVFEPNEPRGKYVFEVELSDLFAGKTARAVAEVEFAAEPRPAAAESGEAWKKLENYYREPSPEYILSAFGEFLANLPRQKEREKQSFNPLPQLAFFYFLLKENPQCVDAFAAEVKKLHGEEKYLGGVVLHFAAPRAADGCISAEGREFIRKQLPSDPFVFDKATAPWQLDVCWAEFMVRGTRAPVMKVVDAMGMAPQSLTVEQYKKIANPTEEDKQRLFRGITVSAACWSMGSLAKRHDLLRWYVEAALVRGEIKDPVAAALAAKSIGMRVETKRR